MKGKVGAIPEKWVPPYLFTYFFNKNLPKIGATLSIYLFFLTGISCVPNFSRYLLI